MVSNEDHLLHEFSPNGPFLLHIDIYPVKIKNTDFLAEIRTQKKNNTGKLFFFPLNLEFLQSIDAHNYTITHTHIIFSLMKYFNFILSDEFTRRRYMSQLLNEFFSKISSQRYRREIVFYLRFSASPLSSRYIKKY